MVIARTFAAFAVIPALAAGVTSVKAPKRVKPGAKASIVVSVDAVSSCRLTAGKASATAATTGADRVTFEPFVGVAPSIYTEMFRATDRKDRQGSAVRWIDGKAEPRLKRFVPSYLLIEDTVLGKVLPATLGRGNVSLVSLEISK